MKLQLRRLSALILLGSAVCVEVSLGQHAVSAEHASTAPTTPGGATDDAGDATTSSASEGEETPRVVSRAEAVRRLFDPASEWVCRWVHENATTDTPTETTKL